MKKLSLFLALLASLASLTACQLVPQPAGPSGPAPALITTATPIPLPSATALPTVLPTEVGSAAPTAAPTADSALQPAEKTVQDYFAALSKGEASAAAKLLSTFSLAHASMTRGDAADELKAEMALGTQWSDLKIQGSKSFDATTVLVNVTYTRTDLDAKTGKSTPTSLDEQWPVRLEAGQWRYNRGNLIDFHTVDVPERTVSGLTVKPREVDRYSDHLSLILLAQNATGDAIAMGTSNTVLATFHFGEQKVDAVQKVIVIDRLRSYPAVSIEVSGQFSAYPDSVDLIQYIHYSGGPWFTFQLNS
jgi:hypothetical protein